MLCKFLQLTMYNHAASFAASRRVGDTAVYNPNRLLERPIPILGPQNIANANENFADDDENSSENDTSNVIENPMSEFIGITVTNENEGSKPRQQTTKAANRAPC